MKEFALPPTWVQESRMMALQTRCCAATSLRAQTLPTSSFRRTPATCSAPTYIPITFLYIRLELLLPVSPCPPLARRALALGSAPQSGRVAESPDAPPHALTSAAPSEPPPVGMCARVKSSGIPNRGRRLNEAPWMTCSAVNSRSSNAPCRLFVCACVEEEIAQLL